MKLHLNKGLRAALLACVCAAVAAPALADTVPLGNQWGDIWLGDDVTYDITSADAGKTLLLADDEGTKKLSVAEGDVSVQLGEWVGTSQRSYEKLGDGTLTITGVGKVASQNAAAGTPASAIVSEGTLKITYGGVGGFVTGTVTVDAGATLQLAHDNALGTTGNVVDSITLAGEEANTANMLVSGYLTLPSTLNLNGHTNVSTTTQPGGWGAYRLNVDGGSIKATGTDNTLGVDLYVADAFGIEVTGAADTLTLNRSILYNSDLQPSSTTVTKSGAGTLTLGSGATIASEVKTVVDEGTLKLGEVTTGSEITVNEQGELFVYNTTVSDVILNGGVLTVASNQSGHGSVEVTSEGGTITSESDAVSAAVFTVGGTGDLTLSGAISVQKEINNTGSVTVEDSVTLGTRYDGSTTGSIGEKVTDVNVTGTLTVSGGATLANSEDIVVSGKLTVNEGMLKNGGIISVAGEGAKMEVNSQATIASDIVIGDGGTVDVGTNPTFTGSAITVQAGGTLDLSDTQTLGSGSLTLDSGSMLIMANRTVDFSGSLTLGENVTIDLSWCAADSFAPGINLFSGVSNEDWVDTQVTIKLADNAEIYGWLKLTDSGAVRLVPEPTTATLSLLALAGLAARRRRK